ncbi:Hypothetical protein SRAE_1000023000 [Strongyloides ratti]|uniref:Uncharacterized protein n=1 Tax=Strongyloides ratti TaxID=34506 RepID=A0A090L382_STRRB|nr:Hypothetical protein SRAE_1000023000 [Strongyloides ratti]CEF61954.1 Hypothetical protein SRAE_1000023000 [Strongyloides ratti]
MAITALYKSNIALEFYPKKNGTLPRNLRLVKNPNSKLKMSKFITKSIANIWDKENLTVFIYNIQEPAEFITIADQYNEPYEIKIDITDVQEKNEILLSMNNDNLTLIDNEYIKVACIRKINYNLNEVFTWKYENNSDYGITLKNNNDKNENGLIYLDYFIDDRIACGKYKCMMGDNYSISISVTSRYPNAFCLSKKVYRNIEESFNISKHIGIILAFLCAYAIVVIVSRNIFIQ